MYKEAARVLKKGGLIMVGFMNPWIYMNADVVWDQPDEELLLKFSIPLIQKELEEQGKITINPEYGYEFSHTLETQIRGATEEWSRWLIFMNRTYTKSIDYSSLWQRLSILDTLCVKLQCV